jgi:hypothetical protein
LGPLLLALSVLSAEPPKVACTAFTCSDDVGSGLCQAYELRFTSRLGRGQRVRVTTQRDVAQIIGLERQKQLLGCSDQDSSCNAELAGALGRGDPEDRHAADPDGARRHRQSREHAADQRRGLIGLGVPIALTGLILALALPAESGGLAVAPALTPDGA